MIHFHHTSKAGFTTSLGFPKLSGYSVQFSCFTDNRFKLSSRETTNKNCADTYINYSNLLQNRESIYFSYGVKKITFFFAMLWKVFPDHGRNTPLAQECSNQLTPLQLVLSLPRLRPLGLLILRCSSINSSPWHDHWVYKYLSNMLTDTFSS